MFPIRDENPTIHTSIMTFVIIGLNIAAWIFIQGLGSNPSLVKSIFQLGVIPGELLSTVEPGTQIPISQGLAYVIEKDGNWLTVI